MSHAPVVLVVLLVAATANAQPASTKAARRTPPPEPSLVLAPAAREQIAAAAMTYVGGYVCELDRSLQVSPNARFEGYVDVRFGGRLNTMKPVLSSTGALRLEDVRGRLLLVQIAAKSMLLDVREGRRLVDGCVSEKQAENRRAMATAVPQPGLGIEPVQTGPAPASGPMVGASGASAPVTPASSGR